MPAKRKKKQLATYDQMQEAAKIKSALQSTLESTRSKKKKKHMNNQIEKKTRSDKMYHDEVIEYLKLWDNDIQKWKFQKTKQVFIQNHVFDQKIIKDNVWSITLKYLSGSKGRSKVELMKRAQEIISKVDAEVERTGKAELTKETEYKRARDLLQMLE